MEITHYITRNRQMTQTKRHASHRSIALRNRSAFQREKPRKLQTTYKTPLENLGSIATVWCVGDCDLGELEGGYEKRPDSAGGTSRRHLKTAYPRKRSSRLYMYKQIHRVLAWRA